EKVIKELDKLNKLPESEVKENLKKFNAEKLIEIVKKPKKFFEKYSAFKEIKELLKYCKIFKVKVKFLPSLARGLAYYNGNIFEIFTKKMKESIAGGGSYLIEKIQSTGISFGLERLSSLAKVQVEGVKCLIISIGQEKEAIELAQKLRKKQISCFVMDKIYKAVEYANAKKIPYVIFVGKKELEKEKFKLRDMKTGEEKLLTLNKLLEFLS
ncbi:MAG: His/Gly/Thr/Pro-type tRNA ligase C-terminal domain-containing protein, partial [Candidatus Pacearchaeota archaeon]